MSWVSFLNLLRGKKVNRRSRCRRLIIEELEPRTLLSGDYYALSTASTIAAGSGLLVQVTAMNGNAIDTNYTGTAEVSSTDPQAGLSSVFFKKGLGLLEAALKTAGSWTFTATDTSDSTILGTSGPVLVSAAAPVKLAFASEPVSIVTGHVLPTVTVQIKDLYGNLVTGDNSDSVSLSVVSGPGRFIATSNISAMAQSGVARFYNLALIVPGTYTLGAVVPGKFTGPYSSSFSVSPLQVVSGSFVATPSGFSLQFNAPYLVTLTAPALYGQGFGATAPFPSVKVTQTRNASGNPVNNPIAGSLVLNTATNGITFVATDTTLLDNDGTPVLPDGTYTVAIASSAAHNGFQAFNGGGGFLDGLGTGTPGSGDYTTTFTVNAAAAHDDVVWVPATADGPGQTLNAPGMNRVGGGYPIYLSDTTGKVTNVQVTLNYNPALLTVTGVTGSGFTLVGTSVPGQAVLHYNGPALATGTRTPIGFLIATVPSGTPANPTPYKAEDLLHLSNVALNGGAIPASTSDALHLVSYVGDADGNGSYSSNDAVLITRALLSTDTGFAAYPLVDPVIVADTDGAGFIPADAALQANEAGVGLPTHNLSLPPVPPNVNFVQTSVAPALSLFTPSSGTITTTNLAVSGHVSATERSAARAD